MGTVGWHRTAAPRDQVLATCRRTIGIARPTHQGGRSVSKEHFCPSRRHTHLDTRPSRLLHRTGLCRTQLLHAADHSPLVSRRVFTPHRSQVPSSLLARDRFTDPQTGVAPGVTRGRNVRSKCRCSMCPASHITSRSWLRSSSTHEPSDPPLGVVFCCLLIGLLVVWHSGLFFPKMGGGGWALPRNRMRTEQGS